MKLINPFSREKKPLENPPIYIENGKRKVINPFPLISEYCGIHPSDFTDYEDNLRHGSRVDVVCGPGMCINNEILVQLKKYPNLHLNVLKRDVINPTEVFSYNWNHFIILLPPLVPSAVTQFTYREPPHDKYGYVENLENWQVNSYKHNFWSVFTGYRHYMNLHKIFGKRFKKNVLSNSIGVNRKDIIGSIGCENFGKIEDGKWVKATTEDLTDLKERLLEVSLPIPSVN